MSKVSAVVIITLNPCNLLPYIVGLVVQQLIQEAAKDFVKFVNRGPSPYHGTSYFNTRRPTQIWIMSILTDYQQE
jgi:hypothetical protein